MRAELTDFLRDHGCSCETVEHALLVVSELIANAVQHGVPDEDGQMEIAWGFEARDLVISVRDAGQTDGFAARQVPLDATSGRGLRMVDQVAHTWAVDHSNGTRVSARLHLE